MPTFFKCLLDAPLTVHDEDIVVIGSINLKGLTGRDQLVEGVDMFITL